MATTLSVPLPYRAAMECSVTREDAKAFKRKFESAKLNGDYTGSLARKTFEEVANLFLHDRRANNRRVSTLQEYQTELSVGLLARPDEKLPMLGPGNIRNIKRADMRAHFNALRKHSISGPRPGEIYALKWPEVYLDVEKPYSARSAGFFLGDLAYP